jgi:hypothetical protein
MLFGLISSVRRTIVVEDVGFAVEGLLGLQPIVSSKAAVF